MRCNALDGAETKVSHMIRQATVYSGDLPFRSLQLTCTIGS